MDHSGKPLLLRCRDFVKYRSRPLRGWFKHSLGSRWRRHSGRFDGPLKLHIGSGRQRLDGWINIDLAKLPEVDIVHDVTQGLPFSGVRGVFAEHFLEHLEVDDALDFLVAVHRALRPAGRLRLSTPNLDWVWRHLYSLTESSGDGDLAAKVLMAMRANRAFYGWRHRFLWNRPLLEMALAAAGFEEVEWCRYGESDAEELRGLEHHERFDDDDQTPHVLVVQARKGCENPTGLKDLRAQLQDHFLAYLEDSPR